MQFWVLRQHHLQHKLSCCTNSSARLEIALVTISVLGTAAPEYSISPKPYAWYTRWDREFAYTSLQFVVRCILWSVLLSCFWELEEQWLDNASFSAQLPPYRCASFQQLAVDEHVIYWAGERAFHFPPAPFDPPAQTSILKALQHRLAFSFLKAEVAWKCSSAVLA